MVCALFLFDRHITFVRLQNLCATMEPFLGLNECRSGSSCGLFQMSKFWVGWWFFVWFWGGFWFLVCPTSGGDLGWAPLAQAMILSWRGMVLFCVLILFSRHEAVCTPMDHGFGVQEGYDCWSGLFCAHGWFCALVLFIRHMASV